MSADSSGAGTAGSDYTQRLATLERAWWKRLLPVQLPYALHLRSLRLGRTLDVGCGLGRNLRHLQSGSVGVDHNADSIRLCRERGLEAYTVDELSTLPPERGWDFDALLVAHVLEHLAEEEADGLLADYLPRLRAGGRAVFLTPQEKGYTTDPTHVRFVDLAGSRAAAERHGLVVERAYSFPFPRRAGKAFPYNEFVVLARKPGRAEAGS